MEDAYERLIFRTHKNTHCLRAQDADFQMVFNQELGLRLLNLYFLWGDHKRERSHEWIKWSQARLSKLPPNAYFARIRSFSYII